MDELVDVGDGRHGLHCRIRDPDQQGETPMMAVPCKGCEYRHLHCHATCEKYVAYVNERHSYHTQKQNESQIAEYVMSRQKKKSR